MIARQHLNRLIEALELVAADSEIQRTVLPTFVHIPDEIALALGDSMLLLDQIIDGGLLKDEQVILLRKLDAIFTAKSGSDHASFRTEDAMKHDEMWKETRTLARKILQSLNQPVREPNLSWIQYVPAKLSLSKLHCDILQRWLSDSALASPPYGAATAWPFLRCMSGSTNARPDDGEA